MTPINEAKTAEDTAKALGDGFDWIKVGLDKIIEYLGDGLLKKILKDVSILIPQIKKLVVTTADKLDALKLDVEEMEAKIERFLYQVLGRPLIKDETKKGADKIPAVTGAPEEPELPGSILWFLWDIERKLEYLWKRVEGGTFPRPGEDKLITPLNEDPENRGNPIGREIDELCEKLDCLTRFLGLTLYSVEWDCKGSIAPDPNDPPEGELHPVGPDGLRHPRATPPKSIKDELHEIEECLDEVKECLDEIKDCLDILKRPDVPPKSHPRTRHSLLI